MAPFGATAPENSRTSEGDALRAGNGSWGQATRETERGEGERRGWNASCWGPVQFASGVLHAGARREARLGRMLRRRALCCVTHHFDDARSLRRRAYCVGILWHDRAQLNQSGTGKYERGACSRFSNSPKTRRRKKGEVVAIGCQLKHGRGSNKKQKKKKKKKFGKQTWEEGGTLQTQASDNAPAKWK